MLYKINYVLINICFNMLYCYIISLGSVQWLWTSQNLEKPAQTQVRIHNTHTPKPQSEIGAPSPTHTPIHKNQSGFGALPYLNPIRKCPENTIALLRLLVTNEFSHREPTILISILNDAVFSKIELYTWSSLKDMQRNECKCYIYSKLSVNDKEWGKGFKI